MPDSLSLAQARRITLAAQGFGRARPEGRIDRRHVRALLDRLAVIQIDSVNVLVRSQELPLFARLGPHRRDLLHEMAARGEVFEYWGHEASLMPVDTFPLLRWRMAAAARGDAGWRGIRHMVRTQPDYLDAVHQEVATRGPLAASELDGAGERSGPWWGWHDGKRALEALFWSGRVSARRRPRTFERVYDLTERLLPAHVVDAPVPDESDARAALVLRAARALGVATVRDLVDYYRLDVTTTRDVVADLVGSGVLLPVTVEGWKQPAYLDPAARLPRRITARALLSPFDSLVWERSRTERLFGFHYRLEIYTPAPKRVHGYYVLPFLLGDRLVARVDLKADRKASSLLVVAAHGEEGISAVDIAPPLADELALMASWLGLDGIAVGARGDLAVPLAREVRRRIG